jgi:hypothetical protein
LISPVLIPTCLVRLLAITSLFIYFNYLLENVIVGNLVVRADPSFGGGELNISGLNSLTLYIFVDFCS